MTAFLKKAWEWLKHNTKVFFFIIGSVAFVLLVLWWGSKNKKINALKNKISILESKLKLEKLALKYSVNVSEIKNIKTEEKTIEKEINKIKKELEIKLSDSMTAEEIANEFKKLGVAFE